MKTLVALVVIMSAHVPPTTDVLLREDFAETKGGFLPAGWSTDGPGWSVENGALRGTALKGESTVYFGSPQWRNIALIADVRFLESSRDTAWVALLVRDAGPDAPGMQLTMRRDVTRRNGLELAARRPKREGDGWRVFQTAAGPRSRAPHGLYRLRIEARDDWFRAFVHNEMVFECPRGPDVSPAGRAGFRVSGATVVVDRVEVVRLAPARPSDRRNLPARPLVIAHRGWSARAPENTLAAYRLAVEAGADMAECDVWLTADRVPVLLHDENLKRTTGVDAAVSSVPLEKVKTLDAGSWKSAEYAGEPVPTLVDALTLVEGKLRLVIEIKPTGMEQEVVQAIRDAGGSPADVMIFSFHHGVVDTITRLEPLLPTVWLVGDMPWEEAARRKTLTEAVRIRASGIGMPRTRANPAIVRMARERGLTVFVWTVDDPAEMRYLARIGVDGIITNRPDELVRLLEEGG
jgi:glycerophosphoryl diester phosphodiesterase